MANGALSAGRALFGNIHPCDAIQNPLGAIEIIRRDLQTYAVRCDVRRDRGDVLVAEKRGNAFVLQHGFGEMGVLGSAECGQGYERHRRGLYWPPLSCAPCRGASIVSSMIFRAWSWARAPATSSRAREPRLIEMRSGGAICVSISKSSMRSDRASCSSAKRYRIVADA